MGLATKQEFLAGVAITSNGHGRRYETLTLPISGLEVRIQSLTQDELDAYEMLAFDEQDEFNRELARKRMGRGLIALSLVDGNGNRLFSDADIESMPDMDAADAGVIRKAARKLSGMNFDVELAKKNSGGASGGEPCSA